MSDLEDLGVPNSSPSGLDAGSPASPPARRRPGGFLRELPVLILIAFVLAILIKTFLVQAFYIPSESMVPTLLVRDRVLVNKLVYRFREPQRGEIIVFVEQKDAPPRSFLGRVRSLLFEGLGVTKPTETDFIKRVIGLPGETVTVSDTGVVTITTADGGHVTLREPYLATERDEVGFGPFEVPAGSYFVMGDNRPNSADSRTHLGPIARDDIIGKAFVRVWPPDRAAIFRRPRYGRVSSGS